VTPSPWPGLTDDELDALGAGRLEMLRSDRYRGTGQACHLAALNPRDRATVRHLYGHLQRIYEVWRADPARPDWVAIARGTLALAESQLMARVQELGSDARGEAVQRVVHDLRGGAATAALAEAELLEPGLRSALERGDVDSEGLEAIVLLARDQAKMMRNALVDLDAAERARDTVEDPHHIDDLVGRWEDVQYRTLDGPIRVRAERDAPGFLSSCCLEFGALDRIAYNLINNAARHTADGEVALQVRHAGPGRVRIAVTNRVDEDHGAWLATTLAEDPAALFRWGATRRRSDFEGAAVRGMGLGIVAQFVAAAFGVPTTAEALDGGYLGATRQDDRLTVWFHWPSYESPPSGPVQA
jgi:signal transduction histidine kinase